MGVYNFVLSLVALKFHDWLVTRNYLLRPPKYRLPVASCSHLVSFLIVKIGLRSIGEKN